MFAFVHSRRPFNAQARTGSERWALGALAARRLPRTCEDPIVNRPGDSFAIRVRIPTCTPTSPPPPDDFTRSQSEPYSRPSRCFATPSHHPRRGSTRTPPSLARTNFHPAFPSHALSTQPNSPSSSSRPFHVSFAAKHVLPTLSSAPPVCVLAAGGRRTKRLRMTRAL